MRFYSRYKKSQINMVGSNVPAPRNSWKANVTITEDTVVKSYVSNGWLARQVGRISLSREERALRQLDGLAGVPKLCSRPNPYELVVTRVPGVHLRTFGVTDISEKYLTRLKALITAIHARGVAHGDAHHFNILMDGDDPYIVDFATAYIKPRRRLYSKRLFKWYRMLDWMRFYRVENRFFSRGERPKMFWLYEWKKNYEKSRKKSNPSSPGTSDHRAGGS